MLGFYNYTVILTYLGMLSAFTGLSFVFQGNLHAALVCLMVSGVCDMFDGKVASTRVRTEREKRFGIQIDSLSDLVCFGVLPAAIVSRVCPENNICFCICGVYLLSALIRLAYFNVEEEERQNGTSEARKAYLGLPVTMSALILPALFALGRACRLPLQRLLPAALLLVSVAFLTPFPLKKPQAAGKIGMLLCGGTELCLLLMGADV